MRTVLAWMFPENPTWADVILRVVIGFAAASILFWVIHTIPILFAVIVIGAIVWMAIPRAAS